jgi:hypothetical protein
MPEQVKTPKQAIKRLEEFDRQMIHSAARPFRDIANVIRQLIGDPRAKIEEPVEDEEVTKPVKKTIKLLKRKVKK